MDADFAHFFEDNFGDILTDIFNFKMPKYKKDGKRKRKKNAKNVGRMPDLNGMIAQMMNIMETGMDDDFEDEMNFFEKQKNAKIHNDDGDDDDEWEDEDENDLKKNKKKKKEDDWEDDDD